MFIALVSFSNDTSIQNLENSMNSNELIQQILTNNSLNTTQFVIWLQNGVWAIIVYFIVCLLISFLALISMNMRILSGFLFLIASIITLPLVLLFVTFLLYYCNHDVCKEEQGRDSTYVWSITWL